MSDFDASLSRSKYGPGGPQKKDDNKLSNLEIIRQELQKRLKKVQKVSFVEVIVVNFNKQMLN